MEPDQDFHLNHSKRTDIEQRDSRERNERRGRDSRREGERAGRVEKNDICHLTFIKERLPTQQDVHLSTNTKACQTPPFSGRYAQRSTTTFSTFGVRLTHDVLLSERPT